MHERFLMLTLPFILFLVGYRATSFFMSSPPCTLPALVGMPLQTAVELLSHHDLNIRLLPPYRLNAEEEAHIPPGTVLSQSPSAHTLLKPQQTVFITVATTTLPAQTPAIIGMQEEQVIATLKTKGIRVKRFYVPSSHPTGICIAQTPSPEEPLTTRTIIAYISAAPSPLVLMPNLKQLPQEEVIPWLQEHGLAHQCHPSDEERSKKNDALIIDQRPSPGTVINLHKPCTIHLYLETEY